ncbi:MAG: 1-(5-phosphoribosyl)-5-[(5-phosphoribosylamino)methylideneamino]imidazole-4-carboxamide isomerase [Firmicutes bacterium]|nr:1-(5-phosphoribosyl)-5-[(5-phosphoribosylamino)methylideneamino]imidazole-4-carboxamide isomerase [Bacillota bacterium]
MAFQEDFLVIPAIDIRQGRCVRLTQGLPGNEKVYDGDPVAVAQRWEAAGARRLHVVDLDGAFGGRQVNHRVIARIARSVGIPIQVGGGLRDLAAIEEALDYAAKAILGTVAVKAPQVVEKACRRYPGRILAGIDARAGQVATEGWAEGSSRTAVALALGMKELGVDEVVLTDIARDGMLCGLDPEAFRGFAEQTGMKVIASGGVASLADIKAVSRLARSGVVGVIVGKALYEGKLDLKEAMALCLPNA